MAFIGRPNLPEHLAGLQAQLMAAQPDPLVALMNAIGQVGAAGFESATKTREDKAKREADVAEATRREQMARESAAINLLNKGIMDMATQGQLGPALNQAMGVPGMGQMPASLSAMGVGAPAGPMSVPGLPGTLDVSQLARLIQAPDPGIPMAIRPPAPKTAAPRVETESDLRLKEARIKAAEAQAGKVEAAAETKSEKQAASEKAAGAQAERIIGTIDSALKKIGATSAGIGAAVMGRIPGSKAKDLATDLTTIKANLGFAELQAMRQASPTGGALGAIAVQELEALQSTVASLDQEQSPEQLTANLNAIRKHYSNWQKAVTDSGAVTPAKKGAAAAPMAAPSSGLTPEQRAARIAELEKKAGKK